MTVVLIGEIPNASFEQYEEVQRITGVDDDPPEGLIIHTAGRMDGGGFRVVDVWESREAYDRFNDERLGPALREVMPDMPADGPGPQLYDVENTVRP